MWTDRDQFSHDQLYLDDCQLISQQHEIKLDSHPPNQVSKQPRKTSTTGCQSSVGDLVYLYCDHNKIKARDRYIVVFCDGE